jgi:outer membrane receptor for ferrienterochelin and colicin
MSQDLDSLYDLSLEQLMNITITTASKQEESITDAAAVVSVITDKDIQSYGALSLVDVLDRATNTYFSSGAMYRDNMLSIRGNATTDVNTNVLILVDGRPMRESVTNGLNSSIYASFPLDRIDRIEIIRGPGSVLYGTCALTGVVNIITKRADKHAPLAGSFRYGTFNTYQGNLTGAGKVGKVELVGGVTLLNTDGWKFSTVGEPVIVPDPQTGQMIYFNPSVESVHLYKKNIGANINAKVGNFKVSANYLKSKQANMGNDPLWLSAFSGQSKNNDFYADIQRLMVDVGYEKRLNRNWNTTVNLTNNLLATDKNYPAYVNLHDRIHSHDHLLEFTNYITPFKNMNLIVGGLLNYQSGKYSTRQTGDDINVVLSPVANPYANILDYNQLWWSAYMQGDYKVSKRIKIIGGMQANKVTDLAVNVVPRGGTIVNFTDNIGAKILYGQAFRSPSQYERNARTIPLIVNNPSLKPELIGTFETQLFVTRKKYEIFLTYYKSTQHRVIKQGGETIEITPGFSREVAKYINGGKLYSSGVELEGKAVLSSAFSLNGSASYQKIEDNEEKKDIFGLPQFMGKLGVTYHSSFGLNIGVFNSYFGKGENIDKPTTYKKNPPAAAFNYLSANVQYDLSRLYQGKKSLVLGLYATNLLDEKVYYPEYTNRVLNTLPGRAGRAFNGSITYKF